MERLFSEIDSGKDMTSASYIPSVRVDCCVC